MIGSRSNIYKQKLSTSNSSVSKRMNLTNLSQQEDLQDPTFILQKKIVQHNLLEKGRKQSSNLLSSPINSATLQNDLIRLFKNGISNKRNNNISQQYFYKAGRSGKIIKTEASDHSEGVGQIKAKDISLSPSANGYIKNHWISSIPNSPVPTPTIKDQKNTAASFASSSIDPMMIKDQSENTILVLLQLSDHSLQFNINANNTTHQLEAFLKKAVLEIDPSLNPVSFVTQEKDLQIDYFLQCQGRKLSEIKRRALSLIPNCVPHSYKTQQQIKYALYARVGLKDFLFIKCIGVGGFSRVYLVKKLNNGRLYAMKLIDKEFIMKRKTECIVRNERDIMAVVDHPFLIRLEHSFEHRNFLVFVLEYCSGGELFQSLRQVRRMTETQAKFYFTEVCLGMLFLHQLSICYRDIKPENILIDHQGHIRIADFGLSKPNMGGRDMAYSFCGSPEYMAPEMLRKEGHSLGVDHYCLGVLLFELVTGLPPFYSKDIDKIYHAILNEPLSFPKELDLSIEIKDLLVKLLAKDPKNRLGSKGGLADIMQHRWFHGIPLGKILAKQVQPPFHPDPLKFNFTLPESVKGNGELNTIDKLLGRTGLQSDIKIFNEFYFDRSLEQQVHPDQAIFYQHYTTFIHQLDQKNDHQFRRNSKQYLIDTSKCSSKGRGQQNSKSPVQSLGINTTKRASPKIISPKELSPKVSNAHSSNVILKKLVQNNFLSERIKNQRELLSRNQSYQFELLQGSKLKSSILADKKLKRRGSASQQRKNV